MQNKEGASRAIDRYDRYIVISVEIEEESVGSVENSRECRFYALSADVSSVERLLKNGESFVGFFVEALLISSYSHVFRPKKTEKT